MTRRASLSNSHTTLILITTHYGLDTLPHAAPHTRSNSIDYTDSHAAGHLGVTLSDNCGRNATNQHLFFCILPPHRATCSRYPPQQKTPCPGLFAHYFTVRRIIANFIFVVPCIVTLYQQDPTRCNSMQVFIYCKITLHVWGVHRTHHQEYIKL